MRDVPFRALAWGVSMAALLSGCLCYRESNPSGTLHPATCARFATVGAEEWTVCGDDWTLGAEDWLPCGDLPEPAPFPPSVMQVLAQGCGAPPPADPAPCAEEVLDSLDPMGEVWEEIEAVAPVCTRDERVPRRPDQ